MNVGIQNTRARLAPALALVLSAVLVACGSDDTPAGETDMSGAESPEPGTSAETPPSFRIDGRGETDETAATLRVVEGESPLTLTIRGADASDGLVLLYVNFAAVEDVVGTHRFDVGGPTAAAFGAGEVDGQVYFSLRGELELTMSADQAVDGRFEVGWAVDDGSGPPEDVPLDSLEESLALSGEFHGSWTVNCFSLVSGFTGGHFVADSPYCTSLTF